MHRARTLALSPTLALTWALAVGQSSQIENSAPQWAIPLGVSLGSVARLERLLSEASPGAFFSGLLWERPDSAANSRASALLLGCGGDSAGTEGGAFAAAVPRGTRIFFPALESAEPSSASTGSDLKARGVASIPFESFGSVEDATVDIAVRCASLPQDYCSALEDFRLMWPKIRDGGYLVFHGGPHAWAEMRCLNGSVIAGGGAAALEHFAFEARGEPVSLLPTPGDMASETGIARIPNADGSPYWVLTKRSSTRALPSVRNSYGDADIDDDGPPGAVAMCAQSSVDGVGRSPVVQCICRKLLRVHFDDNDHYWEYLRGECRTALGNGFNVTEVEMRNLAAIEVERLRNLAPTRKIPRVIHQVYGFKCTNWDTGLWEPSCVDEPTLDTTTERQALESCFGSAFPWRSARNDVESEFSLAILREALAACCIEGSTDAVSDPQPKTISIWREARIDFRLNCGKVPRSCCAVRARLARQATLKAGVMRHDYQRWSQSWRRNHPNWRYILWGPMEVKQLIREQYPWLLPIVNGYDSWIKRNDVALWVVLHHYGGIYANMDVESLRAVDPLLVGESVPAGVNAMEAGYLQSKPPSENRRWTYYDRSTLVLLNEDAVNTGVALGGTRLDIHVVGSVAAFPLITAVLARLDEVSDKHVLLATGNSLFTSIFYELFSTIMGIRVLPKDSFTPFRWSDKGMRQRCFLDSCANEFPDAFGIHHHSNSWFPDQAHGSGSATYSEESALQPGWDKNSPCWDTTFTPMECCDVFRRGPRGWEACWAGGYSYERCCLVQAA